MNYSFGGSPQPHPSSSRQADLSGFDGQRIAIVIDRHGHRMVWCGTAHYVKDDSLGHALRLEIDSVSSGNPAIIIAESHWNGRIIPDLQYGCKYCFIAESD